LYIGTSFASLGIPFRDPATYIMKEDRNG
jgi:hypothetical protein